MANKISKNIDMFLNIESRMEKFPKEMEELVSFTSQEDSQFVNIIKIEGSEYDYCFLYQNKNYPFSLFSNRKLQEYDCKTLLQKEKRRRESTLRTLKLAGSMDLVLLEVLVGKTNFESAIVLLSFLEHGEEKIADYSRNLVMNKRDYFELFGFFLLNELDKYDLYRIYYFIKGFECLELLDFFLLFSKEMLIDLGKNYPYLSCKYGEDGINMRNYTLFSDELFIKSCDYQNQPFRKLRDTLDTFTLQPDVFHEDIAYDEEKEQYSYFDKEFGKLLFRLFSDYVIEEEKKVLLSSNRYRNCHRNAVLYTCDFFENDFPLIRMASVVSGKVKRNDIDYYYHSWIEIQIDDEEIVVLDYNHNICMKKEDYYKLYEVEVIQKTDYPVLQENIDYLTKLWGNKYYPCQFNYFGIDLVRDLKKNRHLVTTQGIKPNE